MVGIELGSGNGEFGLSVSEDRTLGPRSFVESGGHIDDQQLAAYINESDRCSASVGLLEIEIKVRVASEQAFIAEHSGVL